jgi:hypothetical protein
LPSVSYVALGVCAEVALTRKGHFRRRSFPNRIVPIAILNNAIGRNERTAEVPGRRDDGSVRRVTDRNKRYRLE